MSCSRSIKMKKTTMYDRILRHLQDFGSITSLEAIQEYGCTRLSHYIWLMRRKNNIDVKDETISTKNRYGEKVLFKKYFL